MYKAEKLPNAENIHISVCCLTFRTNRFHEVAFVMRKFNSDYGTDQDLCSYFVSVSHLDHTFCFFKVLTGTNRTVIKMVVLEIMGL